MGLSVVTARRTARLDGDAVAEYEGPHGPIRGVRREHDSVVELPGGEVVVPWGRASTRDRNAVAALGRGFAIHGLGATVRRSGTGPTRAQRAVHVDAVGGRWTWHERGRLFWARTRFERRDGSVVAEVRFGNRLAVDDAVTADEVRLAIVCWVAWLDTLAQPVDLVAPV